MDLQLKGRRAIITGSTAGIGYAIARGLAAEGAKVVITGRTRPRVDAALQRLKSELPDAEVAGKAADLGTASGAETLFAAVPEADILVNNLGIYEVRPFFEISDADWLRFFESNVLSGIRFSRHYGPGMAKRGWGRILFVSSESGLNIPREMIHYGMTKTAQLAVSRGLASELSASGVTVNSILPGPTRSEGVEGFIAQNAKATGKTTAQVEEDFFKTIRPSSLIRRFATIEEVANLAVYLCGEGAAATTGAALRVDGGVVATIA